MEDEEYSILQNKFREWFRDPVPADLPAPGEVEHPRRRKGESKPAKFSDLLFYGFGGAITSGSVVGLIIYVLNLSVWRWSSYNWLIQFLVIFFAMVVGFYISLFKVLPFQKRKE